MELQTTSILAVILFTAIALMTDLKNRRIPNWLTVAAAITGLSWHAYENGLAGVAASLGGFATGFGVLLVLWLIGGGGGGDVKLMGAVGAWLGAMPTLVVFIASSGFVILCAIAMIAWRRFRKPALASVAASVDASATSDDRGNPESVLRLTVPYALPVAMSVWTLLAFHVI
ncbi:A24 family peptidase [Stieleria varia]|uniref:Type IV leader peptidase family protein n=1 Tax=Stieleria varia TaxID=2528005 RepID=A0A5C6B6D1_9BACT|nr:A24 family peptidase [Stieleria varia]TWU06074.1 Type IV leader peptidase family protein [Stieleria varia]